MSRIAEALKHNAQTWTDHVANRRYREGAVQPAVHGADRITGAEQHGAREIHEAGEGSKAPEHTDPETAHVDRTGRYLADIPGIRAVADRLYRGGGYLIEPRPEGLRLHRNVTSEISGDRRVQAVAVRPCEDGFDIYTRTGTTDGDTTDWGTRVSPKGVNSSNRLGTGDRETLDLDRMEKDDPIRKMLEEKWSEDTEARSALDRLHRAEVPIDRRLAEAGFEPITDSVMRLRHGDGELTVTIRPDDTLEFHAPISAHTQKVVSLSESQIIGIGSGRGDEPGLRLANDWMDYTLSARDTMGPVDVVLRRPVTAADLGITPITPHTEPTGFVRGGDNPTSRIEQLTEINGYPLDDLERWMRPFDLDTWDPAAPKSIGSNAGYLGTHDSLRQTLARDNDLVRSLGLSHTDLAQAIGVNNILATRYQTHTYSGAGGHTYISEKKSHSMGLQRSPFRDGAAGGYDSHVTNTTTGASVSVSGLGGDMIERYGFYQGPGTSYRSAPEDIISTFGHLLDRGGGPERLQQVLTEVNTRHGWHHPFDP